MATKTKSTTGHQLTVSKREIAGKRRVSRMRQTGVIPGVVYGRGMEPLAVAINHKALAQLLHSTTGEHPLVTLRLEGSGAWEKPVLMQAIQHDPVSGHVLHIDFHTIVLTERLKVRVPLVLKGDPVGVKQDGGVLEHFLREIEVECLPTEIPASVECDVSAMTIGQTVHVRDLTPPEHAKITTGPDGAVASVLKPKEEKPEEEAAAAVTEPEVIREKKEEVPGGEGEAAKSEKPSGEAKKEAKS